MTELQKVPSSASVLARKDFKIRQPLRKAAGGKNIEVLRFRERKTKKKEKNVEKIISRRILVL